MTRFLALFLMISLLLSGCSAFLPQEEDAVIEQQIDWLLDEDAQLSATTQTDDSFALGYNIEDTFHPYTSTDYCNQTVMSLIYESLFVVDSNFTAQLQLATSYTVSPDGLTHQITIRSDDAFSDGSPLTVLDVIDSLTYANTTGIYTERLSQITEMDAMGLYTMTISTAVPIEQLPQLLNIPIVKSETLTDEYPIGSRGYTLNLNTRQLTAKEPVGSLPTTIQLVSIGDAVNVRDSFSFGDIDLVVTDSNNGSRVPFLADFELWSTPTTTLQYLGFQTNGDLFSNSEIRRAMTYAMDRASMVTAESSGFALATTLPISPSAQGYDPVLAAEYQFNLNKFNQILSDADIKDMDEDGILDRYTSTSIAPLELHFITCQGSYQRTTMAERIADQLTELGFAVTLDLLTQEEYEIALSTGNYDMYLAEVRLSPNFDLTPFFSEGGSLSYGGIAQDTLAYLCAQFVENAGNGYNLHKAIMDGGYLCPLLIKTNAVYATRGKYSGFTPVLNNPFWEVS